MRKTIIFTLYTLILLSSRAFAQVDSMRLVKMKEIVITSNKPVEEQAVTKTVIDSVQIAQSANTSLADLISKSTPAFIKTYGQGSIATISFRGTGASHTQVQWNGININNPMLGQVDFSQIPVSFIDDIELYHGGSSLQNNSGALGGAINISTKPKWGEKYHGSIMQAIGSFGKIQTLVTAGVGNNKIQVKLRYLYEQANNDFKYINTAIPPFEKSIQTNANYIKQALTTDIYYNAGKNNFLTINGWLHISDRNIPTIMSYEGLGRKESDVTNDIRVVLKWRKHWENIHTELITGYSRTDMEYLLSNKTYFEWVLNSYSKSYTNSVFNTYNLNWKISNKSTFKTNVKINYHDVETLNKLTLEGYTNDRIETAITASFHHSFSNYLSGYLLFSEELTDGKFSPIMPSVGFSSNPLNNDKLYIAINGTRNYHKPTLNDLYWQPGGNSDLRHEQGYSTDLNASYKESWNDFHMEINTSIYLSWIDDWIVWQPSEFTYWTAQNIQKVFARGIETNIKLKYSISGVNINLNANYAFTRTTNESEDIQDLDSYGKQLIYIPLHKANVLFAIKYHDFYLDFMWNFTGERFTNSSNEMTRHSLYQYSVCDLSIGKRVFFGIRKKINVDIQFKINNIFNVNYQAILWRAMPTINYQLQVKCNF